MSVQVGCGNAQAESQVRVHAGILIGDMPLRLGLHEHGPLNRLGLVFVVRRSTCAPPMGVLTSSVAPMSDPPGALCVASAYPGATLRVLCSYIGRHSCLFGQPGG
jgi:hypothetical protein